MFREATMRKLMLIMLLQVGAASAQAAPQRSCAEEVGAIAVANRLSKLPQDIRADLMQMDKNMGDPGSPLLQTDAPSVAQSKYPTSRFFQALLINKIWFVQVEIAMTSGIRTMGYYRDSDGRFQRSRSHYYGGPACETLKAAANGVYNPGLFNF
jgi:hypothetical protein